MTTKKTATKKVSTVAKKKTRTKKATTKKSAPKKTVRKKTASQTARKRATTQTSRTRSTRTAKTKKNRTSTSVATKNRSAKSVTLPSSAGPRLVDRVRATQVLVTTLERPIYRIAYISGLVFMLVGAVFAVAGYSEVAQSAQVICTEESCVTSDDQHTDANSETELINETPNVRATVDVLDPIPPILDSTTAVGLVVTHALSVDLFAINYDTGRRTSIPVTKLSERNYRFVLDPEVFLPGEHEITIRTKDELGYRVVVLGSFYRPDKKESDTVEESSDSTEEVGLGSTPEETNTKTTDETIALSPEDETVETSADDSIEEATDTLVTETEPDPETTEAQTNIESTDTEPDRIITDDTTPQTDAMITDETEDDGEYEPVSTESADTLSNEAETVEPTTAILPTPLFVELSILRDRWVDEQVITAEVSPADATVELFARPKNSLRARFLGTMQRRDDVHIFVFDSRNIPNGEYEVFGRVTRDDKSKTSKSISVLVLNTAIQEPKNNDQMIRSNDVVTSNQSTEFENQDEQPVSQEREFYTLSEDSEEALIIEEEIPEIDKDALKTTDALLQEEAAELNDLLQRYAVAYQAEDPSLRTAVEKEIDNKKKTLLRKKLDDTESANRLAAIDGALENRIETIKKRVVTFEEVRRSKNEISISADQDKDGVSDYDEINVYGTDPSQADTDNDGFTDGAEIVSGFNPIDSSAETIIDYEFPNQVVGLARPDVLKVKEVESVVVETEEATAVFAEISGVGLPNSFATLYVFSTPTIVTVKTDADGSFVYRFDKELEDGEHEVFVAFTNNTGAVLAHSEPFRFVKEAEAFTPVSTENVDPVVTQPTVVESASASFGQTVLAISLLTFGFFLLMIGIHIRETSPNITETEPAV